MTQFIKGVHPTYKQQFDKLTEAYITDDVRPFSPCACFVGNLLNGRTDWQSGQIGFHSGESASNCIQQESNGLYTIDDINRMEYNFMIKKFNGASIFWDDRKLCIDEELLFQAFASTLEMLKEIHISKGEEVDEVPEFKKRINNFLTVS